MNKLFLSIVLSTCVATISASARPTFRQRCYGALVTALKADNAIDAEAILKREPKTTWGKHALYHIRSAKMLKLVLQYDPNILIYPESLQDIEKFSLALWVQIAQEASTRDAFTTLADYCKQSGKHTKNIRATMQRILGTLLHQRAPQEVVAVIIQVLSPYDPTPVFVEYLQAKAQQ